MLAGVAEAAPIELYHRQPAQDPLPHGSSGLAKCGAGEILGPAELGPAELATDKRKLRLQQRGVR